MSHSLQSLIAGFSDRRILVLGDMVADEYLMGRPSRISREAPVLVLDHTASFVRPGGATNTAYNLRRLGASTGVIGVVGDDEMGRRLRQALDDAGIDSSYLLVDPGRPTSTKTRIVAKGPQEVQQQIVRIDRIDASSLSSQLCDAMIDALCIALPAADALLISDYEHGVLSPLLIEVCLREAHRVGVKIIVDAHGDLLRFKGVTAVTPNQPEAAGTLHRPLDRPEDLEWGGRQLLDGMAAMAVLITRGSEGVALFERGQPTYTLPVAGGRDAPVVDPAGAGDTVAAVFTLAITSGASMRQGAFLGNVAGGEVVRKLGAATLCQEELREALTRTSLSPPD